MELDGTKKMRLLDKLPLCMFRKFSYFFLDFFDFFKPSNSTLKNHQNQKKLFFKRNKKIMENLKRWRPPDINFLPNQKNIFFSSHRFRENLPRLFSDYINILPVAAVIS